MSEQLYPVTQLDSNQVIKYTYDIDKQAVRTVTEIVTPPAIEVAISATSDNIAIGNGTNIVTVTPVAAKTALDVNVIQTVGGGGAASSTASVSTSDKASFAIGTDRSNPVAGVFNDSATALSSGEVGAVKATAQRALHVNLRSNSGQEFGTLANPLVTSGAAPAQQATRIDEASTTITYVGKAEVGTANSDAAWQISRISLSGSVTSIEFADGNANFDNVWNNRASLSYS